MTNQIPEIKSLDDVAIKEKIIYQIKIGDYVGPNYAYISNITDIAGKLAYKARTKDGKWLINFDGEEIFDKTIEQYDKTIEQLKEEYEAVGV